MINITFKNVGQGDSIILEYSQNGVNKIGIIDCNEYNEQNPTLTHLIERGYTHVEFIILSHPHKDHYSGMLELLLYCKENDITVKHFLHTCGQVPDWLRSAIDGADAEKSLQDLFNFINRNHENMDLRVAAIQGDSATTTIPLCEGYSLEILSPTQFELNEFIQSANYNIDNSGPGGQQKANWLSTILKIENETGYVLLTSDAEKQSLIRIDKRRSEELNKELQIGQSPHHGAFGNHNNAFWKKRKRRTATSIVFSVGRNGYNHPSGDVVKSFLKNEYRLHSTNQVGALLGITQDDQLEAIRNDLDIYSNHVSVSKSLIEGDQEFTF